jgi:hypothetical protein
MQNLVSFPCTLVRLVRVDPDGMTWRPGPFNQDQISSNCQITLLDENTALQLFCHR